MDRTILRLGALGLVAVIMGLGAFASARPRIFRRSSKAPQRQTAQTAAPIAWQHDLRTAHRLAVATGKPMVVVFGASWCTYCTKLENETIGHPNVAQQLNTSFIAVHLDFNKDEKAARILEVKSLPSTVILSPDADLLGFVEGYVTAAEFSQTLQQSLDYRRVLDGQRSVATRGK
jgi:thiol:disulfide interchange protein